MDILNKPKPQPKKEEKKKDDKKKDDQKKDDQKKDDQKKDESEDQNMNDVNGTNGVPENKAEGAEADSNGHASNGMDDVKMWYKLESILIYKLIMSKCN